MLDTNVVVAGIRSPTGASREILHLVGGGALVPVVSVPLAVEYESVLKRRIFLDAVRLEPDDVDDLLDGILSLARLQPINFLWRPLLPDPKDDCVLECAVNGGAEAIVTFNKRHFPDAKKDFDLSVMTTRELLALSRVN